MFSKEHMDGVNEFITFVSEIFSDDEEILCPCRQCLNRVHKPKGLVEDHCIFMGWLLLTLDGYILGTFLGIAGKSKDTINSRLDLKDMGIRKNLHLKVHYYNL
ncbi:unnamed protein product [Urochloa humidicola]